MLPGEHAFTCRRAVSLCKISYNNTNSTVISYSLEKLLLQEGHTAAVLPVSVSSISQWILSQLSVRGIEKRSMV